MSGAQSYIVRVLRNVEIWLNDRNHSSEASRIGKIMQKIAQADDVREALNALYHVEQFDHFALRLLWLADAAERGEVGLENGMMEYQVTLLGNLLVDGRADGAPVNTVDRSMLSDHLDDLYVALHRFGRMTGELKRSSMEDGIFKGVQEDQLYAILNELVSLKENARRAEKEAIVQFADACTEFIQYVTDNGLLNDVRIVNVLDNANITLQTVFEVVGVEDNDSLRSSIQLLKRPNDLFD